MTAQTEVPEIPSQDTNLLLVAVRARQARAIVSMRFHTSAPNPSIGKPNRTNRRHYMQFCWAGVWITLIVATFGAGYANDFDNRSGWPQFHHGPERAGHNPYESELDSANVSQIRALWTHPVGIHCERSMEPSPVVANGLVYVKNNTTGRLVALDSETGEKRWEAQINDYYCGAPTPAVANGLVFTYSETLADDGSYLPPEGALSAYDANTGEIEWTVSSVILEIDPSSIHSYGISYISDPTVSDGILYIVINGTILAAFDAATGTAVWSTEATTSGGATASVFGSPAVADGVVYVANYIGSVLAFDGESGTLLWDLSASLGMGGSPVVVDEVVYIVGRVWINGWKPGLSAYDAHTQELLWTAATGDNFWSTPAVSTSVAYVASADGSVTAVDTETGAIRWIRDLGAGFFSSPALANGVVYLVSDGGKLYALDADTGVTLLEKAVSASDVRSSPAVANGKVYVSTGIDLVSFGLTLQRDAFLIHLIGAIGDGTPAIGAVFRSGGKTIAKVKDAASGVLVSQFEFTADLLPIDVEVTDGFGLTPHLVLLGRSSAEGPTAETRDALSGEFIGSVIFNPRFAPVDLTVLPNQDGKGDPQVGLLGKGLSKVEILDAVTGDPFNDLWFNGSFEPRQAITLPDLNDNGSTEVGVLLTKTDEPDRMVIKDSLTDEKVSVLLPRAPQFGFELLQALSVPDADGNPTAKVALLLHEAATGKTLVRVTDATTNAQLGIVRGYNPDYDPVKLVVVADMNGNSVEEYALLARNPDTGQVHAQVRDGLSAEAINTIWFSKECTPLDVASIADINANGAGELVLLHRCADSQLKAVIKDAGTGERLKTLHF